MKKKYFAHAIGLIALSWTQVLNAQPPTTLWDNTFGGYSVDVGYSVEQTTDGGYIVAGWTSSYGAGASDVYLIKTNFNGDTLWTRTFGGADVERAFSVQQTIDGGYIAAGYTKSYGAGSYDLYLVKTNANGDSLWTSTFGGSDIDRAYSVRQTTDGGYIVAGETTSYGAGGSDIYLVRIDANGDSLWTRTYGSIQRNNGRCVEQTMDGGYIIAGTTYFSGSNYCDAYLIKTDSIGDTLWTKIYGCPYGDGANFVRQTTDGGYIIAGWTDPSGSKSILYLIRTDSAGDTLWTSTYGNSGEGFCVDQLEDGGYIVTGYDESNFDQIYIVRTDSLGNTIWTKKYGYEGNDRGHSVQQTTDGGFIVAGYICIITGSDWNVEVSLIKIASETGIEMYESLSQLLNITSLNPNPFSSTVNISYTLPEQDMAEIAVYDLSGRLVETIQSTTVSEGAHSLNWTPQVSIPNGCYLVVLDACGYRIAARCLKLD